MERINLSLEHKSESNLKVPEYVPDQDPKLESLKDTLFDTYMKQKLIEDFFENLGDYVDGEVVDQARAALSFYESEKEIYGALSLPRELRNRKFSEFANQIEHKDITPELFIENLVSYARKYRFGVGYHTSPKDIRRERDGSWSIVGIEPDHRDGDRPMAYYSTKYRHLFKKKDPQFIYIVRTDPTHKTDGNWSRATELSIIARVSFENVFRFVEDTHHAIVQAQSKEKAASLSDRSLTEK